MSTVESNRRPKKMVQAAIEVLSESREPLDIREITDRILKTKRYRPKGKTPDRSLYSIILRENQRSAETGEDPLFLKHPPKAGRTVRYSLNIKKKR